MDTLLELRTGTPQAPQLGGRRILANGRLEQPGKQAPVTFAGEDSAANDLPKAQVLRLAA
eukprot:8292027-Alexandrium_andersonii.AAC.1